MLLLSMPELRPAPPSKKYEPRLYGFKIHPLALKVPPANANANASAPQKNAKVTTSAPNTPQQAVKESSQHQQNHHRTTTDVLKDEHDSKTTIHQLLPHHS